MTIAADSGGRQRTSTDGLSQASRAAVLAGSEATWLRDEEAADELGLEPGMLAVAAVKATSVSVEIRANGSARS